MNSIGLVMVGWLLLLIGGVSAVAFAADGSSRKLKPLEEIVESLEKSGYVIVEAEVDDGHWEVDARRGDASYELHIDPLTGETLSTHRDDSDPAPAASALKLSKLLHGLRQGGYRPILSVEFKRGRWEVEARKGGQKRELGVNAESGKILSDRVDD